MKAKADAMLKKGLISEKQHSKMLGMNSVAKGKDSSQATGKIAPVKDAAADDLDPKSGNTVPKMKGADTASKDNPAGKFRKRGSDTVTRGESIDKDD